MMHPSRFDNLHGDEHLQNDNFFDDEYYDDLDYSDNEE